MTSTFTHQSWLTRRRQTEIVSAHFKHFSLRQNDDTESSIECDWSERYNDLLQIDIDFSYQRPEKRQKLIDVQWSQRTRWSSCRISVVTLLSRQRIDWNVFDSLCRWSCQLHTVQCTTSSCHDRIVVVKRMDYVINFSKVIHGSFELELTDTTYTWTLSMESVITVCVETDMDASQVRCERLWRSEERDYVEMTLTLPISNSKHIDMSTPDEAWIGIIKKSLTLRRTYWKTSSSKEDQSQQRVSLTMIQSPRILIDDYLHNSYCGSSASRDCSEYYRHRSSERIALSYAFSDKQNPNNLVSKYLDSLRRSPIVFFDIYLWSLRSRR